jgi:outer membrane protein OmpU
MKKFLLGTTAVVAATAFGGAAFAQSASEPIKLGLGGYWVGAAGDRVGGGGDLNNERQNQSFSQDSAVYVKGETKFDNGLGVGVLWIFRGEGANSSSTDTVKRSYVRFFGSFGEVRFGDDDDSRLQKAVFAPQAGAVFGVNSPYMQFTNAPVASNTTSRAFGTKRAQRIAYFSPTIAGFSFAASYAPDGSKGRLASPTFATTNTAGHGSNIYSIAGAYDNKFGDFHLTGSAGYTSMHTQGNDGAAAYVQHNETAYDAGINLGWGPITVGTSFEHVQNANNQGAGTAQNAFGSQNNNTFDVGAVYTMGPFSTSLGWSRGFYGGAAVANATAILDTYEAIAAYVLGPGVEVDAAVQLDYYRSGVNAGAGGAGNVGNATNNQHDAVLEVGTKFTF